MALEDRSKEELIRFIEASHKIRARADHRTARANEENASLREQLRKADILNRKLQLELDSDPERLRERLRVAEARIALVRDITRLQSDPEATHYPANSGPHKTKALI